MPHRSPSYFHLHLISDSTGETLTMVARAAAAQYTNMSPIEHLYPLVRTRKQLETALAEIENAPGIVLYTLLDDDLREYLAEGCRKLGLPVLFILGPVLQLFQSYLGSAETKPRVGAQHMLNADYFKRIDALNYTMFHDDGQHTEDLEEADVVLVGISRTSKTPTSIYLANRGVKTANVPLVPNIPLPPQLETLKHPLVVGLYATPERIVQIRQNRLLALKAHHDTDAYIDREAGGRGIDFRAQAVREASLGIDRRDAPLDRGNRRGGAASSWPSAGGSRSPDRHAALAVVRSACAGLEKRGAAERFASGGPAGRNHAGRYRRARDRAKRGDERAAQLSRLLLAREKAKAISAKMPGRLVLGADQTLSLGKERFSKPADRDAARAQLLKLRGKTHELSSGIALVRDGATLFEDCAVARLTMRNFSEDVSRQLSRRCRRRR